MGIFNLNKINAEVCGTGNVLNALQSYNTVVLKPHIVDNKNILTENMLRNANTKYVIRWDYDLAGETITMQPGCIIEFDGGSIKNGTLVGNNTVLIYSQSMQDIIKEDAELTGTWKKPNIIPAIPTKVSAFENDVNYTKGSAGSVRPTNVPVGYMFFDTNLNIPIYWNGTYWVNEDGIDMTNVTMVIGTSTQRNAMAASLSEANEGLKFFDTDFGQYAVWNGGRWVGEDGFSLCPKTGEAINRPQGTAANERNYLDWQYDKGFEYFDFTLGKPIYAKNISSSTGVIQWVDATGNWVDTMYNVTYNLTHLTASNPKAIAGITFDTKLTADTGYSLPASASDITIVTGGTTLVSPTDFTYDPETGVIIILGTLVTGDITITA